MELKDTLKSAIDNAHRGVVENVLGTQEHADASSELNMFAQREIDRMKADDQRIQAEAKIEAEREAVKIKADLDEKRLEAEKQRAEREADIARQRLEAEKQRAERDAEIEKEKIKAEKEKAEREAEVEREKIKAEKARSTKDTVVRVLQLGGVVIVSGLMLITDSDNWMGRGCRVGSSFIQKFLKL